MKDPDDETIQNRQAANDLMHRQAMKGDKICGAYFSLKSLAGTVPGGNFIAGTVQDYGDDMEDEEDMRPY